MLTICPRLLRMHWHEQGPRVVPLQLLAALSSPALQPADPLPPVCPVSYTHLTLPTICSV
eukprot:11477931-Alexandrium_andersonii.AAC.1